MAGETTLIVTTRSGVRPLGVRGEPLHNSAPQLRRVVRRRLGDGAADLLAEPQLHEDGKAIDWYASWAGVVQPLSALDPARQEEVLSDVERSLADIRRLGDQFAGAGPREDMGLVGLSLQLAARAPADSFVFMVNDRPVIVCWGYEKEAAATLLPAVLPSPPPPSPAAHRPVLAAPAAVRALPALRPASTVIPWARTLLAALPLLLLLLGGAWLLRGLLPADPALALATREGPDAPPAAEPAPDPKPALKAACSDATAAARPAQRRSLAPAVGAHQRLLVHGGLLAHRSVPPRDDTDAARHLVLLLRRNRQRPARMAARPHSLPDTRAVALRRRRYPALARRRHDLQRRLALVRRPACLPARLRRRGPVQWHVARRVRSGLLDRQPAQAELNRADQRRAAGGAVTLAHRAGLG